MMANDARCIWEIKCSIAMAKAAFNNKKTMHQQIGLKFKEETSKMQHLVHSFVWC
jgi:hypothetical protein